MNILEYATYLSSSISHQNGARATTTTFVTDESGSIIVEFGPVNANQTTWETSGIPTSVSALSNLRPSGSANIVYNSSSLQSQQVYSETPYDINLISGSAVQEAAICTIPEIKTKSPTDGTAFLDVYSASYWYEFNNTNDSPISLGNRMIGVNVALFVSRSINDHSKDHTFYSVCYGNNSTFTQSICSIVPFSGNTKIVLNTEYTYTSSVDMEVYVGTAYIPCSTNAASGSDMAYGLLCVQTGSLVYPQWAAFDLTHIVELTGSQTASMPYA